MALRPCIIGGGGEEGGGAVEGWPGFGQWTAPSPSATGPLISETQIGE